MKKTIFLISMFMIFSGFYSMAEKGEKNITSSESGGRQSKPDVRTSVNRRYDKNGNLVGYDSTYSWSYTSSNTTLNPNEVDSIFKSMHGRFGWDISKFSNFQMDTWSDSIFNQQFERSKEIWKIFSKMDSTSGPDFRGSFNTWNPGLRNEVQPIDKNVL